MIKEGFKTQRKEISSLFSFILQFYNISKNVY